VFGTCACVYSFHTLVTLSQVYLNGKVIDVSNFKEYLDLYEGMEELAVHESVGGW
jgi:hypothetical protein